MSATTTVLPPAPTREDLEHAIGVCDGLRRRAVVGESAADPFRCSQIIDLLLDKWLDLLEVVL